MKLNTGKKTNIRKRPIDCFSAVHYDKYEYEGHAGNLLEVIFLILATSMFLREYVERSLTTTSNKNLKLLRVDYK